MWAQFPELRESETERCLRAAADQGEFAMCEAELESVREELEMTESQVRVLRSKLSRPASAVR